MGPGGALRWGAGPGISSPWKVLPRVRGLRAGRPGLLWGLYHSARHLGPGFPWVPASFCWASKMAGAPGRQACGLGGGSDADAGSWASWALISRCRSCSDRAMPCTCGEQLILSLGGQGDEIPPRQAAQPQEVAEGAESLTEQRAD